MDAHAEQRIAGWVLIASGLLLVALGTFIARRQSKRFVNGIDWSRIDARDHARVARMAGTMVAAIGIFELPTAAWMIAASEPIRPEWMVVLALGLPPLLLTGAMLLRLQGLYRR
jgi:hypothetical protein